MNTTTAILKKGEGRTIKSGGLWIFDNEIAQVNGSFENGDIIAVEDFDGYFMGWGYINTHSKIRIRLLSRKKEDRITDEFLEKRVRACYEYRKNVIDLESCRLIFGEADFLPGIVVDKFSDILVVESLTLGIDLLKLKIIDFLKNTKAYRFFQYHDNMHQPELKLDLHQSYDRHFLPKLQP